jgi:hypothetical protein
MITRPVVIMSIFPLVMQEHRALRCVTISEAVGSAGISTTIPNLHIGSKDY